MANGHADRIASGALASAMWSYAASVLEPARALRRSGMSPIPEWHGELPDPVPTRGLGPRFSSKYATPKLLAHETDHDHLVVEFDRTAEVYDLFVRPFSQPLFSEALDALRPYIAPDARILDAGCGPARELRRMADLVPQGEVVGIDLSAGMVTTASRATRAAGIDNAAFVQSDVGDLPAEFSGSFDVVFNCLAHHHYPQPDRAAASIRRCLRPGGCYAIIDPGPQWFNTMSASISLQGDPGWIGFHTPDEFTALLLGAGFARVAWRELLPGFLLVIAQRERKRTGGPARGRIYRRVEMI
jgi:SAM-dependent methyltransferase